ncbi:GerAB/ArcD/ProY family transporter [Paenibacillus sinopodophylli]|uniref:GerAB/ArcD/ProY family transporter n=1 Tax=Paenibacillus sinopodophylli TaxID=1837342 RepID=UPI00110D0907|nr:endospore germination permease [Paenibacillus sinopodophylli]
MIKNKISNGQFFFIIFVAIASLTFFSVPSQLVGKVKQDLWFSMVLGTLIDVYVASLLYWLGLKYREQSLIQYTNEIMGFLGRVINVIYLIFFLGAIITSMWIFCDFLSRSFMPETPRIVFSITMTICAGFAAGKGIETIARLSQIIGVLILLTSLILFASALPYVHIGLLFPQFENGFLPSTLGAIYPGSWFGICVIMGMLMPHMKAPKKTLKVKVSAVILGSFIMTLFLLYSIATMGSNMAGQFENPIYILTRISHFIIFERIEVLLLLIFISGSFITISTLFYSVTVGTAQLFKNRTHTIWVYIFGSIIIFSPVFPYSQNSYIVEEYLSHWFPYVALSIEGGLTTLIFLVALIKTSVKNKS